MQEEREQQGKWRSTIRSVSKVNKFWEVRWADRLARRRFETCGRAR